MFGRLEGFVCLIKISIFLKLLSGDPALHIVGI